MSSCTRKQQGPDCEAILTKLSKLWKYVLVTAAVNEITVLGHVALCHLENSLATFRRKLMPPSSEQNNERQECTRLLRNVVMFVPDYTASHKNKTVIFSYWRNLLSLNFVRRLVFNGALRFGSQFCFRLQVHEGILCGRSHWALQNTKLAKTRTWY